MIILKLAQALHRPKKDERGFTLIELIIVVAILAVLAAIAIPLVTGRVQEARIAADKANVRLLQGAVNIWVVDNAGKDEDGLTIGEWEGPEASLWMEELEEAFLINPEEIEHPFGGKYDLAENEGEGGWQKRGYKVTSSSQITDDNPGGLWKWGPEETE